MKKSFEFANSSLEAYKTNDVGVLHACSLMFKTMSDISEFDYVETFFDLAEKDPAIKATLVVNEPNCMNEDEYQSFVNEIMKKGAEEQTYKYTDDPEKSLIRGRQLNLANRLLKKIVTMSKPVFIGLQGHLVTPFVGIALACDFRFASDNVIFNMAHLKYGLHPSSALPFLLPLYLNRSETNKMLLEGKDINVEKAVQLGLIDEILPTEKFIENCLEKMKVVTSNSSQSLRLTKKLLGFQINELNRYFDYETKVLRTL